MINIREYKRVFGQPVIRQTIGIAGEKNAAMLVFDVSVVVQAYPAAWFTVIYHPPHGLARVVDPVVAPTGCKVEWVVPDEVMRYSGEIGIEIQARNGNATVKTCKWPFFIAANVTAGSCAPRCHPPASGGKPGCGHGGVNIDEIMEAFSRSTIVGARIDADTRHLIFDTLSGEPIDAGRLPDPEPDGGGGAVNQYPSFDSLPETGETGTLYLVLTEGGTAGLYVWGGGAPGYINLLTDGAVGLEPGTIIDCRPIEE